MTGGTISAIVSRDMILCLQITDENDEDCLLRISPTNYALRVGDWMSWDKDTVHWRSQFDEGKEIQLFKIGCTLNPK
jgi:hypothetical protein